MLSSLSVSLHNPSFSGISRNQELKFAESINFSANTGSTNQELKLAEVNEQSKLESAEGGCASNFSVVGVLASGVGSCEDLQLESAIGSSEGNNGSVEGSIDGSTNPGSHEVIHVGQIRTCPWRLDVPSLQEVCEKNWSQMQWLG